MPASSSTSFTVSEFKRCGDPGTVARSIVETEDVFAFATASRVAFKTSGNDSGHFSGTGLNNVVNVSAVKLDFMTISSDIFWVKIF